MELVYEVSQFLQNILGLHLTSKVTAVLPVGEGIPWLGMRVFRNTMRLQHNSRKRFIKKMRANKKLWLSGDNNELARSSAASLCGHLKHASCTALRRRIIANLY